jgi:hypothetical protein
MSAVSGSKSSSSSSTTNHQQQSPSRFRETAEPELFAGFPQLRLVHQARRDVGEIGYRRNFNAVTVNASSNGTLQHEATSVSSVSGDPAELDKIQKAKAKRSRATNIEVMLQSAVDPKLRQKMMDQHKQWSDGRGSRFRAFDILRSSLKSNHDNDGECTELKDPPLPTRIASVSQTIDTVPSLSEKTQTKSLLSACAACSGRMVIHSCGKRAKPVDHEALAKAEAERQAAEEAEKQRVKAEKRRAAEAKRREARKKKKEEEERKRREEELQKLEEERVAALHKPMASNSVVPQETESFQAYGPPPRKIPRYAELMSAPVTGKSENDYSFGYAREQRETPTASTAGTAAVVAPQSSVAKETYARQNSSNVSEEGQSVYSSTSFTPAAVEPLFKPEETTPLEDTNTMYQSCVAPPPSYTTTSSTAFSERSSAENDALAMLAGLADQSAKAPFFNDAAPDSSVVHYDYSGAEERRRTILDQFHHSAHAQTSMTTTTAAAYASTSGSSSVYDRPLSSSVYGTYHYATTSSTATNGSGIEINRSQSQQQSTAPNGASTGGGGGGTLL